MARTWSIEQEEMLKERYGEVPLRVLGQQLGKTESAVRSKYSRLCKAVEHTGFCLPVTNPLLAVDMAVHERSFRDGKIPYIIAESKKNGACKLVLYREPIEKPQVVESMWSQAFVDVPPRVDWVRTFRHPELGDWERNAHCV